MMKKTGKDLFLGTELVKGHYLPVFSVLYFDEPVSKIVTSSQDNNVCVFDSITLRIETVIKDHPNDVHLTKWNAFTFLSACGDTNIRSYELSDEIPHAKLKKKFEMHNKCVHQILKLDEDLFLSTSGTNEIRVISYSKGTIIKRLPDEELHIFFSRIVLSLVYSESFYINTGKRQFSRTMRAYRIKLINYTGSSQYRKVKKKVFRDEESEMGSLFHFSSDEENSVKENTGDEMEELAKIFEDDDESDPSTSESSEEEEEIIEEVVCGFDIESKERLNSLEVYLSSSEEEMLICGSDDHEVLIYNCGNETKRLDQGFSKILPRLITKLKMDKSVHSTLTIQGRYLLIGDSDGVVSVFDNLHRPKELSEVGTKKIFWNVVTPIIFQMKPMHVFKDEEGNIIFKVIGCSSNCSAMTISLKGLNLVPEKNESLVILRDFEERSMFVLSLLNGKVGSLSCNCEYVRFKSGKELCVFSFLML